MKRAPAPGLIAVLVLATLLAFSPILSAGFINWDDPVMVTQNATITGLTWSHLVTFFTTLTEKHYHPLVFISYAIDYRLFGLDPLAFHLTNVAFHVVSTILVFRLFSVLTGNSRVGFVTAALFGFHPMHVESVAWIAERKDVMYAAFFWGSLLSYVLYVQRQRRWFYWAGLGLFVLSLLSKSMAMTLPLVLVLIDRFLGRKLDRTAIVEKLPHVALSCVFAIIAVAGHYEPGVRGKEFSFSGLANVQSGFENLMFYLVKLVLPFNLAALYPAPRGLGNLPAWLFIWSPVLIGVLGAAAYYFGRGSKPAVFGLLFFLVTFLPASPILPVGIKIPADRYSYVPYVGLFFLLASLVDSVMAKAGKAGHRLALAAGVALVLVSSWVATFRRVVVWRDSATLWEDSLAKHPVPMAYHNLGLEYLTAAGKRDTALTLFSKAIAVDPGLAAAWLNRGVIYGSKHDYERAIANYNEAERLDPRLAEIYVNRGNSYLAIGMAGRAIKDYSTAVSRRPAQAEGWYNRGNAYLAVRQYDRAIADFTRALALENSFAIYNNRGNAYLAGGDVPKAFADFSQAILLEPLSPNAYYNRARVYAKNGQPGPARTDALRARSLGMKISDPELAQLSGPATTRPPGSRPTAVP